MAEASSFLVNARTLTIEWGHCDPAGIVFNPRFFEYFDWSTTVLFETALGMAKAEIMQKYGGAGMPLVDTRARFLKPARFGDVVNIASTILSFGKSSFEVQHKLFHAHELAVEGHEKRVWTGRDPDSGRLRSQPIPEEVIAQFVR